MNSVFIIAGESSGELYGALLARALRDLREDIYIYGVGGERMHLEGVRLIAGISGAFGLTEAISSLRDLRNTFRKISNELVRKRPSVVVLIDFPDFNLKVAEKAKLLGVKVLYYVSPQVWAWRKGRIKKIKDLSDKIAVVLPFEENLYRSIGADCEFVGHPIMEEIEDIKETRELIKEDLGLNPQRAVLGLLPGSRHLELKRLLPLYLSVVKSFKGKHTDYQYILPFAPNLDISPYKEMLSELEGLGVRLIEGRATEALMVSDNGLIASGTATLQAALIGVPMVVVYKLFPLTYLIGRMLVDVRYISLVNLLTGKEVVKELIQWNARADNVLKELERIMIDDHRRSYILENFQRIRSLYEGKKASLRVAEMVEELSGW